jgi:electron transfer flavoprotein beta subunit
MRDSKMKILVILREVIDPSPPVELLDEGALLRERGLRRMINPADLWALDEALSLAATNGATVTAAAIGPKRVDDILREASSMGANELIRIWDNTISVSDSCAEVRLLVQLFKVLEPTIIFTGGSLLDRLDDPAFVAAAETSTIPCASRVVGIALKDEGVEVLRKGDSGKRQRVSLPIPCALTFDDGGSQPRYPSLDAVEEALSAKIEVWGVPQLGLSAKALTDESALMIFKGFTFPRQKPLQMVIPDANLPAFERIAALLSGGISPREGQLHLGSAEEVADALFTLLCEKGVETEVNELRGQGV